jgi:hypothetical protein
MNMTKLTEEQKAKLKSIKLPSTMGPGKDFSGVLECAKNLNKRLKPINKK